MTNRAYEELEPRTFSQFFRFLETEDWLSAGKTILFQARDEDSRLARAISVELLRQEGKQN